MIKRIVLKNFMAHKETVIDLAEGVTVITGPNNVGKSAIVEAVRALAQNPGQGKRAIRHGARSAVVHIELEGGGILEWERTEKSAVYRIHRRAESEGSGGAQVEPGECETATYAKFGHAIPEDIRSELRLDSVTTESGEVDIHIGNQRYPIFLLDQAGSQAASFFAASTEAVHLLRMQQALKSRTDRSKAKKRELTREALEIEKELARYAALDALAPVIEQAEADYGKIVGHEKALPIFAALIERLFEMLQRCGAKERAASALASLASPVELRATASLDGLIIESEAALQAQERLALRRASLGKLRQAPPLHDAPALDVLLRRLLPSRAKWMRAREDLAALRSLSPPPLLADAPSLAAHAAAYDSAVRLRMQMDRRAEALQPLGSPPLLREVRELEAAADAMEKASFALGRAGGAMGALIRLSAPPRPLETRTLRELLFDIDRSEAQLQERGSACAALAKTDAPPAPADCAALSGLIEQLAALEDRTEDAELRRAALGDLALLPVPHALGPLDEHIHRMGALHGEIARLEGLRENVERQCAAMLDEVRKAVENAGACPFCGQPMDATHFLEAAHAGNSSPA